MTTTPDAQDGSAPREYERLSVNLIEKAVRDLADVMQLTGLSKTDTANRALQMYAYLMHVQAEGGAVLTRDKAGDVETLKFL
jgi:hypothetical protein